MKKSYFEKSNIINTKSVLFWRCSGKLYVESDSVKKKPKIVLESCLFWILKLKSLTEKNLKYFTHSSFNQCKNELFIHKFWKLKKFAIQKASEHIFIVKIK